MGMEMERERERERERVRLLFFDKSQASKADILLSKYAVYNFKNGFWDGFAIDTIGDHICTIKHACIIGGSFEQLRADVQEANNAIRQEKERARETSLRPDLRPRDDDTFSLTRFD